MRLNNISVQIAIVALLSASGLTAQGMKLGDAAFAKALCAKWNTSKLPKLLAAKSAGGNDWIDTVTSRGVPVKQPKGYQKIVSGRKDCPGWPKFELVIEKQSDGTAKCTSAGAYNGKKVTWQFLPNTDGWFSYATSFGYGAFMRLWMNGMVGDMMTGKKNQGNFQIFFRLGGQIALNTDYKTGCKSKNFGDADKEYKALKQKWAK